MENSNNKYPYFKKCSRRDAKRIFALIAELDSKDGHPQFILNKYNLSKMVNYQCYGYDLTGSNCEARDPKRHFLVNNNRYDVYEIPMRSNKNGLHMTGNFAVLLRNLDFGYWTFALMNHQLRRDNRSAILREIVKYWNIAELDVTKKISRDAKDGFYFSIYITEVGSRCCRGFKTQIFDDDDVRKLNGYHTSKRCIYKSFGIDLF